MGTNYYGIGREACSECNRPYDDKEIHIGKSSAGWTFSFAWNDGEYYKTADEFKEWLKKKKIVDEYGREISNEEFWDMVKVKQGGLTLDSYYEKYPTHNTFNANPSDHEFELGGLRFVRGEFS